MIKKLFSRSGLPVLVGIVMVFGLFGSVLLSQQQQDQRSKASSSCSAGIGNREIDNCTINGNIAGNLKGNNNTIIGNVYGFVVGDSNKISVNVGSSVYGNSNTVGNNVNGCVIGNNNHVSNNVVGTMQGSGNTARQVAGFGTCPPNPYITPTAAPTATPVPTRVPATCADGIDNNRNERIDSQDPACHTDGNPDNPNSYDPTRNEVNVTPTLTITPTSPASRCSDNTDNDSNGFKDSQDSTCHTDNNPNNPNSYDPTRPGEQGGGSTCTDSRDNNNNNLTDGADPICHTDGNANNPDSYNPDRSEVGVTPSVTVSPTSVPTIGPTSTPVPGNTTLSLNLLLHGIGQAGDSANPTGGGNANPLHPQRSVKVEIFNTQNQLVLTKDGSVNYNASAGNFTGNINAGNTLASGSYTVKVKTNQLLKALVPGIQTITSGAVNQLPSTVLINGDVNNDNLINILDYNILMGCYSDLLPAVSCTTADKLLSDLDDDGDVNQFDYNLFLRELTNRGGV